MERLLRLRQADGASPFADKDAGEIHLAADTHLTYPADVDFKDGALYFLGRKFYIYRNYAHLSTQAQLKQALGDRPLTTILATLLGILSPTIKAHFEPPVPPRRRYQGCQTDPSMQAWAIQCKIPLHWRHLGISGSLCQGLNSRLPMRAVRHPATLALGLIQLSLALSRTLPLFGKEFALPLPARFHSLWSYRAIRWPILAGISLSTW